MHHMGNYGIKPVLVDAIKKFIKSLLKKIRKWSLGWSTIKILHSLGNKASLITWLVKPTHENPMIIKYQLNMIEKLKY